MNLTKPACRSSRTERTQEVVCNALRAYVRLYQLGKVELAYATVLARYGIAQVKGGRKLGGHLNIRDVSSAYCQAKTGAVVERLDHFDEEENAWREAVVRDTRTAPVPEIVSFRVDFAEWLHRLSARDRRLAGLLALGHRTADVASRFRLSPGRISQKRRQFFQSWNDFQGEAEKVVAELKNEGAPLVCR